MDTRNLTLDDIRYIDELCLDANAMDAGGGLERALDSFAERHGIELAPGEIYHPTYPECVEISRLAVESILGGIRDV
jgi:hypothetical protein